MQRTLAVVAGAVAAVGIVPSAASSQHPLTVAQYRAQATAICAAASRQEPDPQHPGSFVAGLIHSLKIARHG